MPLSTIQLGRTTTLPDVPAGRRNMIINGDLMVDQRAAVSTQTGSGGKKPVDGWRQSQSNVGQLVVESYRSTDAPANTGLNRSIKLQVKTPETDLAANEDLTLLTKIEGHDCQKLMYGTANAKTTTLSFWVKSSIAGTFAVGIYSPAPAGDNISKPYTISSANTWEYKTITFPGNTLSGGTIPDDSTVGLQIQWFISIGSNSTGGSNGDVWHNYTGNENNFAFGHVTNTHATTDESTFQLTGVQFEMGDSASPFEFRTFDQALAKCQRYLYVQGGNENYERFAVGYAQTSGEARCVTFFPVQMRAVPDCTLSGGEILVAMRSQGYVVTSITVDYNSPTVGHVKYYVDTNVGSMIIDDPCHISANNNTNERLKWSAEL